MSLVYLGSLSLGAALPLSASVSAAVVPKLQAEVAGLIAAQLQITAHPPTILAALSTAQAILASIQAMIVLGVEVPTATLQLSALTAALASLQATLDAALAIDGALSAGGMFAYAYDGPASDLGPALTAEIAPGLPGGTPSDACHALLFATSTPATWAAMQTVFAT